MLDAKLSDSEIEDSDYCDADESDVDSEPSELESLAEEQHTGLASKSTDSESDAILDDQDALSFSFCKDSQQRAVEDWQRITEGAPLLSQKRTYQRFNEQKVRDAVAFILNPENCIPLSWGRKTVRIEGCEYDIPSITRKRLPVNIWRSYVTFVDNTDQALGPLSRSAFLGLVDAITNGNDKALSAVDYVTGFLVNDNFALLGRIISHFSPTEVIQKELNHEAGIARNFLKNQYSRDHATIDNDSCASHSINYGLCRTAVSARTASCNACKFPFYFIEKLKGIVQQSSTTTEEKCRVLQVLTDSAEKFTKYQGHRLRVINQQKALDALKQEMIQESLAKGRSHAHLVIDFKMKYESKYHRGKTTEFFGKRGVGWHGALLIWYERNADTGEAVKRSKYIDQILKGSNKQDGLAVAALLEAAVWQVKRAFPFFERITLQSDNAKCYHAKMLLLMIPLLSFQLGIHIAKYIHTETQDGKGLIDAHFAKGSQHVDAFIGEGHDAATPDQVFEGLASNRGLDNSFTQLVVIDRVRLLLYETKLGQMIGKYREYVPRANEIEFQKPPAIQGSAEAFESIDHFFLIRCFDYSNVGLGRTFRYNIKQGLFERVDVAGSMDVTEAPRAATESESEVRDDGNTIHTGLTNTHIVRFCESTRAPRPVPTNRRSSRNTGVSSGNHSRSLTAYALRNLESLLENVNLDIGIRDGRDSAPEYVMAQDFQMTPYEPGWAVRPPHGKMYGKSYIDGYRPDIRSLFDLGVANSDEKMHASWMLERLKEVYPNRFDLPSEQDIRTECTRLFKLQKDGKPLDTLPGRGRKKSKWMKAFEEWLKDRLALESKPNLLVEQFKRSLLQKSNDQDLPEDFPSNKKLASKVSSLKTKMKNRLRATT